MRRLMQKKKRDSILKARKNKEKKLSGSTKSANLSICNDPMVGVSKATVGPCNKDEKETEKNEA